MTAYISFDTVPGPKGAATHIEAFAKALGKRYGRVRLVTPGQWPVASGEWPVEDVERWPGVLHTELPAVGTSLIDRVMCFQGFLARWLDVHRPSAIQFRSIFEGYPLLARRPRAALVFEVNGMPSIELKYRYPRAADDRELMAKIRAQECACLDAADAIVTPSGVTKQFLARWAEKVEVIPNGVDLGIFEASEGRPGARELVYFGTLSAWQGVEYAVRSMAQLVARMPTVRLTVLGVGNAAQREGLGALAAKLGVAERLEMVEPVERTEVARRLRASFAVLAPLPVNDRNVRQGCCPLKILEGMAAGVPVIASDLPVVRDLGEHGEHLLLVKPGSVDQITAAVAELDGRPELWARVASAGRRRVEERFTWDQAGESLGRVWDSVRLSRSC